MQIQLPIFPTDTKLINQSVGFREQDGIVYYLHNGNPIYCHATPTKIAAINGQRRFPKVGLRKKSLNYIMLTDLFRCIMVI
jgi:hypothetical protein